MLFHCLIKALLSAGRHEGEWIGKEITGEKLALRFWQFATQDLQIRNSGPEVIEGTAPWVTQESCRVPWIPSWSLCGPKKQSGHIQKRSFPTTLEPILVRQLWWPESSLCVTQNKSISGPFKATVLWPCWQEWRYSNETPVSSSWLSDYQNNEPQEIGGPQETCWEKGRLRSLDQPEGVLNSWKKIAQISDDLSDNVIGEPRDEDGCYHILTGTAFLCILLVFYSKPNLRLEITRGQEHLLLSRRTWVWLWA